MKKPNFFFIGAPKCGTTAMANWLQEHPRIFMTQRRKEPMFFDNDIFNPDRMSLKQYESLFRKADDDHLVVGEASTSYLRSLEAVQNILEYSPSARFLVAVRNPVEMAPSVHAQLMYTQHETIADFEEAWQAQEDRVQGKRLPSNSRNDPASLMYADVCRLGEQLERLLGQVSRDRVMVVFMDDMKADSRRVYLDILDFLGVPDDGRSDFPSANVRKRVKLPVLGKMLAYALQYKRLLGLQGVKTGAFLKLHAWNEVPMARTEPDEQFRKELIDCFEEDILLLGELTGRDVSGWLR
ncbi:sulfotransferase [Halieaceae bacterium IMCC14734]|uniref:Sulfotransferase n=1 Tax=Candidatus Litorirhabdus singularis TaxID=2518993 RepID=A0ABT3TIH7_9GAMM|nr:sulfotransferase [Candidatus Litorirhabdus singularis]MCX2982117.1 sulfotransferase [Candidatus Litorirhabdus singularis]